MDHFVKWFRNSTPYINAHRGKTFVVCMGGEAVASPGFPDLVQDLTLLASLGVRLVLVHGIGPQFAQRLEWAALKLDHHDGIPVLPTAGLPALKNAIGATRLDIEAAFSSGLPQTPMDGASLRVVSGNFVIARPVGVRGGVDHQHSGEIRRLDTVAIRQMLQDEAIVLLSPIGYSTTGETFFLQTEDLATEAAIALGADKLIFLEEEGADGQTDSNCPGQMDPAQAERLAGEDRFPAARRAAWMGCIQASRSGVPRTHLIPRHREGALLLELFTRDGIGTLITAGKYDVVREATVEDIGGLLALIAPLEAQGILVHRSREQLELEIGNFVVMERDQTILACAALYAFADEDAGEIACVAVDPDYRELGLGHELLTHLEQRAWTRGLRRLFVLTTQTAHWFIEHGYRPARIEDLPVARQALYNYKRNSKVFLKTLQTAPTTRRP
ncbi:MAG TPA: amino-acid N-acetyltransferase [Candidatus Acidoferrales bacterium]|nr:amino-acid N-acetyltransferase [Candidatus Acidoferrales bacterium]